MIKSPPAVGAVRIHMDPESIHTLFGGVTVDTFQGVGTLITPAGPFKMEGARWHLLSQVFSSSEDMKTDLHKERLLQETIHKDPNCRSFSWKVLRQAKLTAGATTYIGDMALTAPLFFDNAVREDSTLWGSRVLGPRVTNLTGLSCEDQVPTLPRLRNTNNWILLSLAGKKKSGTTLSPPGGFHHSHDHERKGLQRKWWLLGDNELAEYDRKVEVWNSNKHKISKNLLYDLKSLLNYSSAKDVPDNGTEGVEGKY